MTTETDFSNLRQFPGETGNAFDVILHSYGVVQQIPAILFAVILLGLAALPTWFNWPLTLALWAFFLLDWLLVALLPRLGRSYGPAQPPVLILVVLRTLFAFIPAPWNFVLQGIGTLLVIYSFWIEPHRLTLTRQNLQTDRLPANTHLRVLHLGDLHIERITRREKELQRQIENLQPDLILFSGDILNLSYRNDPTAFEQARQVMRQWKAPLGTYLVSGSPAVDLPENMPKLLEGLEIQRLRGEKVSIPSGEGTIDLIGLTCTHRPFVDGPKLEELLPAPPEHFTILLYHTPDLAPVAARLGVDLQLSGHTHGGQVRIPVFGALFTGSLYGKRYEAGRIQVDKMILYVTRGIGLEGASAPRLRLFCPPEIILWDIKGRALFNP
jgi:predicted MPP superfamily phosphohydrolase